MWDSVSLVFSNTKAMFVDRHSGRVVRATCAPLDFRHGPPEDCLAWRPCAWCHSAPSVDDLPPVHGRARGVPEELDEARQDPLPSDYQALLEEAACRVVLLVPLRLDYLPLRNVRRHDHLGCDRREPHSLPDSRMGMLGQLLLCSRRVHRCLDVRLAWSQALHDPRQCHAGCFRLRSFGRLQLLPPACRRIRDRLRYL